MASTYDVKYSQYDYLPSVKTIEDEQLRKEIESIPDTIKYKKVRKCLEIFRIAVDHTYKLDDPLLTRHFLFKAAEELNNDLIKNDKPFRLDFGYDISLQFLNETDAYYKKYKFYNEDGSLNLLKVDHYMETLDMIIKMYTNDAEFMLYPKKLETDLVIIYL